MNIEDLKDSELITELYERMTAPKESNIDRMIREAFERIDNIIELACDDLDELKKDYEKPLFDWGVSAAGRLSSGMDAQRQQNALAAMGSMVSPFLGLGAFGSRLMI